MPNAFAILKFFLVGVPELFSGVQLNGVDEFVCQQQDNFGPLELLCKHGSLRAVLFPCFLVQGQCCVRASLYRGQDCVRASLYRGRTVSVLPCTGGRTVSVVPCTGA